MSAERKSGSAPVSVYTAEHPNPSPPTLMRAAMLISRASARLAEAETSLRQAQEYLIAAKAEVRPGDLFKHTTLRADVLRALLAAKLEARTLEKVAATAKQLAEPPPLGAEGGGAL